MATAVETGSEPRTPSPTMNLPIASLLGSVYVGAALAIIFFALPRAWAQAVSPRLGDNLVDWVLWIPVVCAVVYGLLWFGKKLAGDHPPRGLHGGIFLMISAAVTIFFLWRAIAMSVDGMPGMILSGLIGVFMLFLAVRFFTGSAGERWMVGLEEQGWFSTARYKPSLGVRVRRLTTLGVLILGGTALHSLEYQGILPQVWSLKMPFDMDPITVLPSARSTVLIVIGLFTGWIAFRSVNIPTFSEFLIATEAEMNKVSWTPKQRLAQDTVVVLTTTLILTIFLLVVDLFWGWLLSRPQIGVLPPPATAREKGGQGGQQARW